MSNTKVFKSSEGFLIVFNGDFWTDGQISFGTGSVPMLSFSGGIMLRGVEVEYGELRSIHKKRCDWIVEMHQTKNRVFVTNQGIMTVYNGLYWTDGQFSFGTDPAGPLLPFSTNHFNGSFVELRDLTTEQTDRYLLIKKVIEQEGNEASSEPNVETVHVNVQKESRCA
jgi:hypothetical protein